jgi:CRISPR/Cas system CSM-associated protein Csm3 (group 7 of RAMP superfamily)
MTFRNRWLIEGFLTTKSPLHIGCGDTVTRSSLKDGETPIEIAAVATDVHSRPYIPGSTLKGNMRAWMKDNGVPARVIEQIFGSEDTKNKNACGGKCEFLNAYTAENIDHKRTAPYRDRQRLTGVTASVAIDRHTGTASEQKLFHIEFVPPGVTFKVRVTGQDLNDDDSADNEILPLLFALEKGFSADIPVTLGSSIANGWGQCEWRLGDIRMIDAEGVKDWLDQGAPAVGYDALQSLYSSRIEDLRRKARGYGSAPSEEVLRLNVTLVFESNFLVNDRSRTKKAIPETEDLKPPDHAPLVNCSDRVLLPASSIRGAFRGQAEKILRTLKGTDAACYQSSSRSLGLPQCETVEGMDDIASLCPACKLFGAQGWRAPVEFSDFVSIDNGTLCTQQFVAIDRFTGGGAEGFKFDAQSSFRPVLGGSISIHMQRLDRAGACGWGPAVIALTLRDLMEGDITLGFGSSKGYGVCSAKVDDRDVLETLTSQIHPEWLNHLEASLSKKRKGGDDE